MSELESPPADAGSAPVSGQAPADSVGVQAPALAEAEVDASAAGPVSVRPEQAPRWRRLWERVLDLEGWIIDSFRGRDPRVRNAFVPFLLVALVLFVRHPATNYIFDEQEALLANPYVNGAQGLKFWDVVHRDFWGLPPNGSIGSYRPIPDAIWRLTWQISKHPFFHHLYNIVVHAMNASLLAAFAFAVTRRRAFGWLAGAIFCVSAVLTEAVSGIVGLADVLGGLGALLALHALRLPAAGSFVAVFFALSLGLFSKESALVCVPLVPAAALLFAPSLHPQRPARWSRMLLSLVACSAAFVLYVELRKHWFPSPLAEALAKPLSVDAPFAKRLFHDFLVWFRQAPLPRDPLNNPLASADSVHRIAGALRVYFRGLGQLVLPLRLSGDYSFPQEPVPEDIFAPEIVAGGVLTFLPLALGLALWVVSLRRERSLRKRLIPAGLGQALLATTHHGTPHPTVAPMPLEMPLAAGDVRVASRRGKLVALALVTSGVVGLVTEVLLVRAGGPTFVQTWPLSLALICLAVATWVEARQGIQNAMQPIGAWPSYWMAPIVAAFAMVWVVVSYFPHSNIPVLLPTVRAERFWYFPAIGSSCLLAVFFVWFNDRFAKVHRFGISLPVVFISSFLGFQAVRTYMHSMDYRDDLAFWYATKLAVPRSAKAHLNYSVMVGARGDLQTRLAASKEAIKLAPNWPMAHVYTGDTLCRLHRGKEAWPHYAKGFDKGPNDYSLISLGLQCMYDEKFLLHHDKELRALAEKHPGSWIAYLAIDTLDNHESHKGVNPKYRPRGYNEGVK